MLYYYRIVPSINLIILTVSTLPINSASSGNPFEQFFAKNPTGETVCYFALWYWLNIQFNILRRLRLV